MCASSLLLNIEETWIFIYAFIDLFYKGLFKFCGWSLPAAGPGQLLIGRMSKQVLHATCVSASVRDWLVSDAEALLTV